MTTLGQLCMLAALVGSGFASGACLFRAKYQRDPLARWGDAAGILSVLCLTAMSAILTAALLGNDFRFACVQQYSGRLLPWYFRLSAFWVGQAGSLLLWAWFSAAIALIYRFWPGHRDDSLRRPVFGVLMAGVCFLTAIMVFGADPMEPGVAVAAAGEGLTPSLQHPAMLIHPPIVFLGYAAWSVPFALAAVALAMGQTSGPWRRQARGWALFAWGILGAGILIGADWAYEELGWGGYWAWDPVENASLVPWLAGTALLHALLAWQHRGTLKKTAVLLAAVTFALCNLAAFVTRSGSFSSLHAFSQSPLGWMFLAWMLLVSLLGGLLVVWRRRALTPEHPLQSVWSREALTAISILAWLLLAAVTIVGAVSGPLTRLLFGRSTVPPQAFYNQAIISLGLLLLLLLAAAPWLRWGRGPNLPQRNMLGLAAGASVLAAISAWLCGIHHPVALAVTAVTAMAAVSTLGTAWGEKGGLSPLHILRQRRRPYGSWLIHAGIVCLAVGITGSSLGSRRHETSLQRGAIVAWAGHSIRFVQVHQQSLPDQVVMQAELEITAPGGSTYTLLPAQHLHLQANQWSSEVAIHSTWWADFYVILHGGQSQDRIQLTLVENPLMRWLWFGGGLSALGLLACLWPQRRRSAIQQTTPRQCSGPLTTARAA